MIIEINIDTENKQVRPVSKSSNTPETNKRTLLVLLGVLNSLNEYNFILDEVNLDEALDNFKYVNTIEVGV